MITPHGYSKDPSILPEGIVITWSKDMLALKGGIELFTEFFEKEMRLEGSLWLQKSKNRPNEKYEQLLQYVYIIVAGKIEYRLFYGGYEQGETVINTLGNGNSFARAEKIWWPRIVCAGPFEKAPYLIVQKGFQGFRYCTKLF